jgi:hypothetical protein
MNKLENEFYANEKRIAAREYHNAIGDDFNADAEGMSADQMEADAIGDDFDADAAGVVHAQKALPFILTLTNTNTTTVTSIPIFYANNYLFLAGSQNNTLNNITYTVSNYASYTAFLQQSIQKPFHVGKTYWTATAAIVASVNFLITYNSADGRTAGFPLIPIMDKYALNTAVNDSDTPYVIDGNSLMTLNIALPANGTIQIQFYPASTVSLKKQLNHGSAKSVYSDPYHMGMVIRSK